MTTGSTSSRLYPERLKKLTELVQRFLTLPDQAQ